MKNFSHLDSKGRVTMVDVGAKPPLHRVAVAESFIRLSREALKLLKKKALPKGDVLTTAQVAGILAAKDTARLIPLCHTLPLDKVSIQFETTPKGIRITGEARTTAKTGVEMETLTAVSVAALVIYDMCKAVDKGMVISNVRLLKKTKSKVPNSKFQVPS
jgi:cyclic pyranopterin monophosphate synthase